MQASVVQLSSRVTIVRADRATTVSAVGFGHTSRMIATIVCQTQKAAVAFWGPQD